MKTVLGKAGRSGFYYSLIAHLPVRKATGRQTRMDALGGVMVVVLSAGMVLLMRRLLTN